MKGNAQLTVEVNHACIFDKRCHCYGERRAAAHKPVLQVYDIGSITATAIDKYKLHLSDGTHLQRCVLASQLIHYIKSGQLQKGSIIKLLEYVCNTLKNCKIIIVHNLEVVLDKFDIIGEPKLYVGVSPNGPGAPKADSVPGNAQPYGLPNVADRVGEGPNLGRSSLHSKAEAETEASVTNIANGKNYGILSHHNMANQNQTSNMHGPAAPQQTPSYRKRRRVTLYHDLSGEAFSRFMDQLYDRRSGLIDSNKVSDNLGALHAIVVLIEVKLGESTSKVSKISTYIRNVFESKRDPEILMLASRARGFLAQTGGGHDCR
ncbi:Serine/threonine-protein kinase [Nymphaea thermarum]|nr:Serine/threonine-protein kinase [Nymphaea thermarum]